MNKQHLIFWLVFQASLPFFLISCGKEEKNTEAKLDSLAKAVPLEVDNVMGIAVIEPAGRFTNLASESNGLIESIRVEAGQTVSKGQTLLILNNALEKAQLEQAQSKIGTQKQAIEAAVSNLSLLKTQMEKAQKDLSRDQNLFDGKAITKDALENSKYIIENLEKQISNQRVAITQQQAKVSEINADIKYFQTLMNKKVVKAMHAGTLLSVNVQQGEYLSNNQVIADFAPSGPIIALTEIDELFASKVALGQKAVIKNQGSQEIIGNGTVILTSPYLRKKSLFSENSNNLEDRRVREVRVQLNDASKVILGARVECWIDTKN